MLLSALNSIDRMSDQVDSGLIDDAKFIARVSRWRHDRSFKTRMFRSSQSHHVKTDRKRAEWTLTTRFSGSDVAYPRWTGLFFSSLFTIHAEYLAVFGSW